MGERRSGKEVVVTPEVPFLDIHPEEELLVELERCFVGFLVSHMEAEAVKTCLFMEGWIGIEVVPMGEKMVLLKGNRREDIVKARAKKRDWWKATFSKVVPWSPNLVATSRRVWVQLRGIPLHIWHENFFKRVGNLFGSFLDFDEKTASRKRLDVANILISTKKIWRIDEWVSLKVMGAVFKVWVVKGVTVFEEGEGSVEEDSDLSKDREDDWEEEDEARWPEDDFKAAGDFSDDEVGDDNEIVPSV